MRKYAIGVTPPVSSGVFSVITSHRELFLLCFFPRSLKCVILKRREANIKKSSERRNAYVVSPARESGAVQ